MLAEGKHEFRVPFDMTRERDVAISHRLGMLEIRVDGETLIRYRVRREGQVLDDRSGNPAKRTQFGQLGDAGRSFWKRVSYSVKNPTLDDVEWSWDASSGEHPDEYHRTRMIQVYANDPDQKAEPRPRLLVVAAAARRPHHPGRLHQPRRRAAPQPHRRRLHRRGRHCLTARGAPRIVVVPAPGDLCTTVIPAAGRPLRNRHSRAEGPLHTRHSRYAGGNPGVGGASSRTKSTDIDACQAPPGANGTTRTVSTGG